MNQVDLHRYALGAVGRKPHAHEHLGISYEEASRRAQAICAAAGKTGQTINATAHLVELTGVMTVLHKAV